MAHRHITPQHGMLLDMMCFFVFECNKDLTKQDWTNILSIFEPLFSMIWKPKL